MPHNKNMASKLTFSLGKGRERLSFLAADSAVEQFERRAFITDGKGSLRIDGVDIPYSDVPSVMNKVREHADREALGGFAAAVSGVRQMTNVNEYVPETLPIEPGKNIQIFVNQAKNKIVLG